MIPFEVLDGLSQMITITESSTLARILAYMGENIIEMVFEIESQQNMVVETIIVKANKIDKIGENLVSDSHRLKVRKYKPKIL